MMTNTTPMLAVWHWHSFGHNHGGLVLLLIAMVLCALIIAWPSKSEDKK